MSEIGRIATWYEHLFPAWPAQIDWLQQMRPAPAPRIACDLGCGTGLHLEALRERGLEVFGLDASEEMLAAGRERCPSLGEHLLPGEMQRADEILKPHLRGQGAGIVLCLGNALASLPDDEALVTTLKAATALKHEDGVFVAQVINFDRVRESGLGELPPLTRPLPADRIPGGAETTELRFFRRLEEAGDGSLVMHTRLETPTGEIAGQSRMLELSAERLEAALQTAGLGERTWFGDYDARPWSPEAPATLVLAR